MIRVGIFVSICIVLALQSVTAQVKGRVSVQQTRIQQSPGYHPGGQVSVQTQQSSGYRSGGHVSVHTVGQQTQGQQSQGQQSSGYNGGQVSVQTGQQSQGQQSSGYNTGGQASGQTQNNAGQQSATVYTDAELCNDCDIRNGVGYNPHPDNCNQYAQCFPVGQNQYRAYVRSCPAGLFWDQSVLTCNRPSRVSCARDPCQNQVVVKHGYSDSCRGFWRCSAGKTLDLDWCGPFQAYDDDRDDCDDDRSCVDDDDEDETLDDVAPCHLEEDEDDDTKFYTYQWGQKTPQFCAPGTIFTRDSCGCGAIDRGYAAGCREAVYLPMDDNFNDESGRVWINNVGCNTRDVAGAVGGKAGYFNGNCELIIPRFSGVDFGTTVVIRLRYKEDDDGTRTRLQALVSNSDCTKVPSVMIAHDEDGDSTKAILRTGRRDEYITQTYARSGEWKEVEYEYDGDSFILRSNGAADGMVARGRVRIVQSALHVGNGAGLSNFKGYIDDLKVYLCKP